MRTVSHLVLAATALFGSAFVATAAETSGAPRASQPPAVVRLPALIIVADDLRDAPVDDDPVRATDSVDALDAGPRR